MLKLFLKTFGRTFYTEHAGLFLFIFYLLFGSVEAGQLLSFHHTLMLAVCASPLMLAMSLLAWLLYGFKCLFFIKKQMKLNEYQFVVLSGVAKKRHQLYVWIGLYGTLFLPLLLYTLPLLYVGISSGYYISCFVIVLYLCLLLLIFSGYQLRKVNHSHVPAKVCFRTPTPKFSKPYRTWLFYYLLEFHTLMFVVSKILSFVLFRGVIWMFSDVQDDPRVGLIALLAAVLSHSMLVYVLLRQEVVRLAFTKSLPIALSSRIAHKVFVLAGLFIPEILLYANWAAYQPIVVLQGILFGLSGLLSLELLLYLFRLDNEQYLKWILFFFLTAMFIILAHYYVAFSLLLMGGYFTWMFRNYNHTDLLESIENHCV